ncbi:hypothetical protein QDA11_gp64 [Microbacterium phage Jayden]|uniref:Uncharacterized protein n=1 Tax=Microbacterium phage Jayden TaxID=2656550 RepID=A0A649VUN6_9CAUD|nr:hypothetical protein QDA11_gp64 [Microbacterium phage Jayden]QGJ95283.1 hypothetical protein PBI_JAYDEN_64 [Microbacterium phage Jayden]
MKISVKSSSGGGMFGGGPSSEVTIEAADYDSGAATVVALALLAQNGIGEFPTGDGDDETVGTTSESTGDDVPAAGWKDDDASANWQAGDQKPDPGQRESNPGDAVLIRWHGDESERLFIDSGVAWVSPAVAGLYGEPMTVEYAATDISVEVVGHARSHRDGGA